MNCKNHFEDEAGYSCSSCGQPICLQCTVELNNKSFCKECLEKHIQRNPVEQRYVVGSRKSKFFTFCLGVVPGAGHLYLGLINKGMSLMSFYFGVLFSLLVLENILHMSWLSILIAPLSILCIFYSVFDALATMNDLNSGRAVSDSSFIGSNIDFDNIREIISTRKKTIGYMFVIVGLIGVINIALDAISEFIREYLHFEIYFSFSSLLIPVLLIVFGVYLLKKSRDAGV